MDTIIPFEVKSIWVPDCGIVDVVKDSSYIKTIAVKNGVFVIRKLYTGRIVAIKV